MLEAARKLKEHCHAFVAGQHAIAAKQRGRMTALNALEDAEFDLAKADAEYTSARLKVLTLMREKRQIAIQEQLLWQSEGRPLEAFWRVCATGTDEEIVAAAEEFGESTRKHHALRLQETALHTELETAHAALSAASSARKAAVQKRGKAKADLQAADQALQAEHTNQPNYHAVYRFQDVVMDLAYQFTGTYDMRVANSFCNIKDLGLAGPGLELPPETMSPEEVVRYQDDHGFGRKRAPDRED